MVQLVDELERRGLVERKRNPNDRRSYQLTLTPDGEETWARAKELAEGSEDQVLAALDDDEREALRELLARVVIAHDLHNPCLDLSLGSAAATPRRASGARGGLPFAGRCANSRDDR